MKPAAPKPAERHPVAALSSVGRVGRVQAIEATPPARAGLRDSFRRLIGRGIGPSRDRDESLSDAGETHEVDDANLAWRMEPSAWPSVAHVSPKVHPASAEEIATQMAALVEHLARFCTAPPVTERGRWTALFPLPFAAIEQTRARLEISPTEVELRFETEHPPSRELLRSCAPLVANALRGLVNDGRQVEVRLW